MNVCFMGLFKETKPAVPRHVPCFALLSGEGSARHRSLQALPTLPVEYDDVEQATASQRHNIKANPRKETIDQIVVAYAYTNGSVQPIQVGASQTNIG